MQQAQPTPSPWGSRGDRRREREAKRDAVLATAVRLFNQHGFQATALDDVALALKVTKPTIYRYFASKDAILFECLRLGLDGIRDAVKQASAQGGSGLDRLKALMQEYARFMTRDFGVCVIRTADDQLSPASRERFRAGKRQIDGILRQVIADGMADGSIAPGDLRLTAFAMAGALNWIARWYDPAGEMTPSAMSQGVVELLVSGLAPRGETEMPIPAKLGGLRLPAIAAPMFLTSGPDLVVETCNAGVLGTFPALNQRSTAGFSDWLDEIAGRLAADAAPYGVNLIVHRTNPRVEADLAEVVRHRVPLVITSLGAVKRCGRRGAFLWRAGVPRRDQPPPCRKGRRGRGRWHHRRCRRRGRPCRA